MFLMDFAERNRNVAISRWQKIHSRVRLNPRLSKEKVAINSYLCGDGNIKVREKSRNYEIRFYLDDFALAERVVFLFEKEFGISPKIRKMKSKVEEGKGYFKVEICNKPVCLHMLGLGSYGSLDWTIPKITLNELKKEWVKCFFDCEAYVNLRKKQIQLKSVNGKGLKGVVEILEGSGIFPKLYGPYSQKGINHNPYYFLIILGKENIKRYSQEIGFYHSRKIKSLQKLIHL